MTLAHIAAARATASQFLTASITITRTPTASTFDNTTGKITTAAPTTIYSGPASITDPNTTTNTRWGGQQLDVNQVGIRAPLCTGVLAGDAITVTNPGDWPGTNRTLWVDHQIGRTEAVLARVVATTIRPGTDG